MNRLCILAAGLLLAGCRPHEEVRERAQTVPGHEGYHVHQNVALQSAGVGNATLQLLEDERITPVIRASFQRGLPDDACRSPSTDTLRVFCGAITRRPLRSALLRLADTTGGQLDTAIALERPVADVVLAIPPTGAEPAIYGVTVDLSADAGSYSGPLLELVDVRGRRLAWLHARDAVSDSVVDVALPRTLKTGWQIVPSEDGTGHEILLVACRPLLQAKANGFTVTYTRFALEQREWRRHQRTVRGFWENDEGAFPPRSEFP